MKFFISVLDGNTNRRDVNNVRKMSSYASELMYSNTEFVEVDMHIHGKFLYLVF